MATTETQVAELRLNRLTKAQYEGITSPSNTELYFVKDEAIDYNDLINTPEFAPVATSNSYDDLDNKPEILQADWLQTDQNQMDYIQNKPNVPETTSSVTLGSSAALTSGGAYLNLVSNVATGITGNTITVTKGSNTSTITIDNVSNAQYAENAGTATSASTAQRIGTATIGAVDRPVYINNGTPTRIDYTIGKSVPADAKFTDTTYNVFTGASSSADGTVGLVRAPEAGQQDYYLKGDGSWATINIDSLPSQAGNNGKYLTTNGTDASWSSLATVATSGNFIDLSSKPKFNGIELGTTSKSFYGTSNSAADATTKEVNIPTITELTAGQIIIVQPTITSTVANSLLKLNSFDAYPMRYNGSAISTSTDSVVWGATFPSMWLFDGQYWVFLGHGLDSNSTYALNASYDAGNYIAGTGTNPVSRYSIIAQKGDGTWEKITATNASYSTGTSKSVNTSGFRLNQLRYYGSTTAITTAGAKLATNTCYEKASSVDLRYSTNCGGTTTWAAGDYMYLVGTINATDGLFYLDTSTWWTKNLPSSNDGKLYIRLGIVLTAASYTISFFSDRPIFYHNGTKLCEYRIADNKQDILVSGTNIKTVNNQSIVGSGNVTIDTLPSQSGNTGKFLTTDGTDASWADLGIDEYTANEVTTLWDSITPTSI